MSFFRFKPTENTPLNKGHVGFQEDPGVLLTSRGNTIENEGENLPCESTLFSFFRKGNEQLDKRARKPGFSFGEKHIDQGAQVHVQEGLARQIPVPQAKQDA